MREYDLHKQVKHFLDWNLPETALHNHPPNEGKRGWRAQQALKDHGTVAGWPDIEILYNGTLRLIELKAPKKYCTPTQKACHERLRDAGFEVVTCRSLEEVQTVLELWQIPLRGRIAA